jgi:hypothetical protein
MNNHPAVRAAQDILWEHTTGQRYDQAAVESDSGYRNAMLACGAIECPRCGSMCAFADIEYYGGAACPHCTNSA